MKLALILTVFAFSNFYAPAGHAWGGRAHDSLCQAATFAVKNEKLRSYLKAKGHILGYLCNIPDTSWKSIGLKGFENQSGYGSHFVDVEMLGLPLEKIPRSFKEIEDKFTGKASAFDGKPIKSAAADFGSAWWRLEQFQRRNLELAAKMKSLTPPDPKDKPTPNHPYVEALNSWIISLGLTGHFAGDLSQPFHGTVDYDGYGAGHGGIHGYYEENVVSAFDADLIPRIAAEANRLRKGKEKFLTEKDVFERGRELSRISLPDIALIYKADKLAVKSTEKEEKGMSIRKAAERVPLKTTFKTFEPLVIKEMGRGAALLALLWDEAYVAAGEPDLEAVKSYWFPPTPEFIPVDYATPPTPTPEK